MSIYLSYININCLLVFKIFSYIIFHFTAKPLNEILDIVLHFDSFNNSNNY